MKISKETAVIEYDNGTWMVMDGNGNIGVFRTAEAAFKYVTDRPKKLVSKKRADGVITSIEWRNVPEGFKPPSQE